MKIKHYIFGISSLLIVACGGSQTNSETESDTKTLSENSIINGKELISKSDCLACHKEQEKLVGPAYIEVAKKYAITDENINLLANKIINGGSGVWGSIPMTPHPQVSQDDAKSMVKYILNLK